MSKQTDNNDGPDQKAGVEAVIEPIKAVGGLIGFGVGFMAAHRSGADLTSSTLHGLVGAALLWIVAWFLAVYLVREMMTRHIEEQRRVYNERVEALRTITQGSSRAPAQQALQANMPRAQLGPPGS
jgi:hypothetical protein